MGDKDKKVENDKLSEALAGIPRTDAPANFEQKVMNRIKAGENPAKNEAVIWPWMKLALPVLALVFVGAFLYLSGIFSTNTSDLPFTAEVEMDDLPPLLPDVHVTRSANANETDAVASATESGRTPAFTPDTERAAQNAPIKAAQNTRRRRLSDNTGGGSVDHAITAAQDVRVANTNVDANANFFTPLEGKPEFERQATIPAKDIFALMGLTVSHNGRGWLVRSVDPVGAGRGQVFRMAM